MSGYQNNDRPAADRWRCTATRQGHQRAIRQNRRARPTAHQEIDAAGFEVGGKCNKKFSYASTTIGSRGREHSKELNPTELIDNYSPEWLL